MKRELSTWIRQLVIIIFFSPFIGYGQYLHITNVILPDYSPLLGENEQVSVILDPRIGSDTKEIILDSLQFEIRNPDNSMTYLNEVFGNSYKQTLEDTFALATRFDFSVEGNYEVFTKAFYHADGEPKYTTAYSITGKMRAPKLTLPIIEDFESITESAYYEDSHVNLPGLSSGTLILRSTGQGNILSTVDCDGPSCDGFLTNNYVFLRSIFSPGSLIFTYDLSDYLASSNQLRFQVKLRGTNLEVLEQSEQVQVMIRGNADKAWIKIYDWYDDNSNTSNERTVFLEDISTLLTENDQDFGTAFQVAIRTKSLFFTYGSSFNQGLSIDDMVISEVQPIDVAVGESAISPFGIITEGTEPLTTKIINRGTIDVSEIPITAHITYPNGEIIVQTEEVSETLSPGDVLTYDFKQGINYGEPGHYRIQFSTALASDTHDFNNLSNPYFTGKLNRYEGGLPFLEDFEDAISADGNVILDIEGVPGASFYTDQYRGALNFWFDEDFESTIYGRGVDGIDDNERFIFTLDLSDQQVASDNPMLSFRFWYKQYDISDKDVLSIRGNMDTEWLPLFKYDSMEQEVVQDIELFNISETLAKHGQEYSESFQIRFSNSGDISLGIDDIYFGEREEVILSSEGVSSSTVSFPNPTHDYLMLLDKKSMIDSETVQLTDLLGRTMPVTLEKKSEQQMELDLRSLKSGMYFLTWKENGERQRRKIIRE